MQRAPVADAQRWAEARTVSAGARRLVAWYAELETSVCPAQRSRSNDDVIAGQRLDAAPSNPASVQDMEWLLDQPGPQ